MNKELGDLFQKALVEYIVNKVVEKLIEKQKTALVMFTGATIGFKQSIESLNQLQKDGWKLQVVMSKAAQEVLTEDLVKSSLGIDAVIKEGDNVNIKELLSSNNVVVIPSLTMNTAAKIANCISDTLVTNIVSKALMSGKKVIASINGCCVSNPERQAIYGDHLTEAHKNRLINNLELVQSYGIELTSSENLNHKVGKVNIKNLTEKTNTATVSQSQAVAPKVVEKSENQALSSIKLDKKVISRIDVYNNRQYNCIVVNDKALVTELALDEAKKFKMKIIRG